MTRDFENMLYLFGCGALGKEPLAEHCVNIRRIREISIEQNVWPIVYSAIRKKLESGEVKIPPEIYNNLETSFEANIAKTLQKNEFNKRVIKTLGKRGVECCLFKGMALAQLYNIPETRVSGDADILIKPEDEVLTAKVLRELGYDVSERAAYDHHISAIHPVGGELEVHISVMRKNWDDIIFSDKISYKEEYIDFDEGIKTLGINDSLVNAATHFIKHFVRRGAGVRHIMDLLLYIKKYENQINTDRFSSLMEELRYKKLINTVKAVGVKYWGFSFDNLEETDNEVMEKLLTDIENGGTFGAKEYERAETYAQFTQRRKKMTKAEYKKYSLTKMDKTILQKILPDKEYMKKAYNVEKCYGIWLVIAHIKRWFSIIFDMLTGKKDYNVYMYGEGKETSVQAKERIELFEMLDIID